MRRRVTRIIPIRRVVFCLILGLITTVAIAWGCSLWSPVESTPNVKEPSAAIMPLIPDDRLRLSTLEPSAAIMQLIPEDWHRLGPLEPYSFFFPHAAEGLGRQIEGCDVMPHFSGLAGGQYLAARQVTGWPAGSLSCTVLSFHNYLDGSNPVTETAHALRLPTSFILPPFGSGTFETPIPIPALLPLDPVWPGFAIDWIFWCASWLAATALVAGVRRRWRKKRGLCVKCAYDLRSAAHEHCPECGEAVRIKPGSAKAIHTKPQP